MNKKKNLHRIVVFWKNVPAEEAEKFVFTPRAFMPFVLIQKACKRSRLGNSVADTGSDALRKKKKLLAKARQTSFSFDPHALHHYPSAHNSKAAYGFRLISFLWKKGV